MTIVSGLRNKAGESPAPHAIIAGTWLTCVPPPVSQAPHGGVFGRSDRGPAHRTGHAAAVARARRRGWRRRLRSGVRLRVLRAPLPFARRLSRCRWRTTRARCSSACSGRVIPPQERHADHQRDRQPPRLRAGRAPRTCSAISARRTSAMVSDYLDSVREVERRVQKMMAKESSGIQAAQCAAGRAG